MSEAEETNSNMNFICPYCGEEQGDSWEYAEENQSEHDCDSCGETFNCWAVHDVTYYAEPIPKLEAPSE